jgi:hypothetical protein
MSNSFSNGSRLEDRFAIQEVIYLYSRGIDRRDWALVRSLFHPDAYDDHGMYKGDIDGFIDFLRVRHSGISQSFHLVGNILIEFPGPQTALVETYVLALQRLKPVPRDARIALLGGDFGAGDSMIDTTAAARYVDKFEHREAGWRIRNRLCVYEKMSAKLAESTSLIKSGWTIASRDEDDPLVLARRMRDL